MQKVPIPISGIDRQVDELSTSDGSCLQIDKFRPSGRVDNPMWEVIPNPDEYTFAPDENWGDPENTDFTIVKIHYAFDTWYAFVFFDDGGEQTALYSCTFAAGVLTLDTELFNAGSSLWISGGNLLPIEVYFQDFGEDAFYMLITPGKEVSTGQHQLWKITPDGAEPAVHRPELHLIQVTVNDETATTTVFNALYPSDRKVNAVSVGGKNLTFGGQSRSPKLSVKDYLTGVNRSFRSQLTLPSSPSQGDVVQGSTYPGILKDKDKYFGIITAFKHPNGEWVKHSQPHVFLVEGVASFATNTEYATLSFGLNPNYTNDVNDYDDNFGDYFNLYGHTGGESGSSTPWQRLNQEGIFMTTGKATAEEAFLEGTYYLLGILESDDTLDWSENEETIVTGEVLNIDPYSHHVVTSKAIGSYGRNLVMVRSVTNFALPGTNWHSQSIQGFGISGDNVGFPKINESVSDTTADGTLEINDDCLARVRIETDKGTFYRWNRIALMFADQGSNEAIVYLPPMLSYPDRDAREIELYWGTGSGHKRLGEAPSANPARIYFKKHPYLNIAYTLRGTGAEISEFYITFTTSGGSDRSSDIAEENAEMMVEENEFKISDLTKLFFPLEWSYQVNDKISAVVNNTNEVGQGQFGSYPLYIFGENSLYGALGGDGVLIAKFDQISNQHGMNGFESYAVFKNRLYFVSNHGIHALSGIQIEDIYDLVEDLSVHFITTNPTTKIPFFEDGSNLVANSPVDLYSNILSEVQVGVNPKTREIVFSGNGGLLIFNEKYRQWYTYTVNGEGDGSNPYEFAQYDQLLYKDGDLHILESPFVPKNATILQWGTGTSSGFVSLVTNPMVLTNYGLMKRLRQSLLQGTFIINGVGSDPGNGLYALNVTLEGKRSTHDDWERIISYTEDTVKTIKSFYIKSNAGSYQAFRLVINGDDLAEGTVISNFLCEFIDRGRRFRR